MPLSTATQPSRPRPQAPGGGGPPQEQLLVARLGLALAAQGVRYCQWKGHAKRARWSVGDGDLDLLVARTDCAALVNVLHRLGFKLALPPASRDVPGALSYFGLDAAFGRLIHVHLHVHLVVGRPWSRHYRMPIEPAVLRTAVASTPFPIPAPEFQLLLLVVQATFRHSLRDAGRRGRPAWLLEIQPQLERLEHEVPRATLAPTLARHLPEIDLALFDRCRDVLRPGRPPWTALRVRAALERRLRALAGGRPVVAALRRVSDHAARLAGTARRDRKRLAHGGALVALIGADGAGKSTCARALEDWLAPELLVRRAHMGRPPRSALTLAAGALLKAARWVDRNAAKSPWSLRAHCELLRSVCTGRDRYGLYRRMRRFTRTGGVAICERYPIPENAPLVGASAAQGRAATAQSRVATLLRRLDARYYARITLPDIMFVLRVDPETAIRRKADEPAAYVRARAGMLWNLRWARDGVVAVDARRPLVEVVAELRARVWEAL